MIDRLAIIGSADALPRARSPPSPRAGVTTPMIHPFLFDEAADLADARGARAGRLIVAPTS